MFLTLLQLLLFFLLLNSFETKAKNSPFFNLEDFGIENTDDATPIETHAKCKEEGISKINTNLKNYETFMSVN